jgi:hypothetical protein
MPIPPVWRHTRSLALCGYATQSEVQSEGVGKLMLIASSLLSS